MKRALSLPRRSGEIRWFVEVSVGFREWLDRLWGNVSPDRVSGVTADGNGILFNCNDGTGTLLSWVKLDEILIHAVGGGGSSDRIHYIFRSGDTEVRVALTVPGLRDVIDRLPHLPGFDGRTHAQVLRYGWDEPATIWKRRDAR